MMSDIFGLNNSHLFDKYMRGKKKAIFPCPLSIVDCYFLFKAFQSVIEPNDDVLRLLRLSDSGKYAEYPILSDAFDLYDVDRDASGVEVVLTHRDSGTCCYWDTYERFVTVAGHEEFLSIARPYPDNIERHRYIEAMLHLEDSNDSEMPETIYEFLKHDFSNNP